MDCFSKLAEKSIIIHHGFCITGFLASFFFFDISKVDFMHPFVKLSAEITLILVLFLDASTINLKELIRDKKLPIRLLLIGLPITMIAGILVAIPLFPGMNLWILAMMALILSPTDAALGLAVVTSKYVPEKIRQNDQR